MNTAFFFQTQQIPDSSIFNQLKEQNIFFSYFQVDQKYYLFLYSQKSIDINFLYQSVDVIQELDSKQRKIRVNGVNRLFYLCFRNSRKWKRS